MKVKIALLATALIHTTLALLIGSSSTSGYQRPQITRRQQESNIAICEDGLGIPSTTPAPGGFSFVTDCADPRVRKAIDIASAAATREMGSGLHSLTVCAVTSQVVNGMNYVIMLSVVLADGTLHTCRALASEKPTTPPVYSFESLCCSPGQLSFPQAACRA